MRPLNKNIKVKIDYPNIKTSDVYRINFEHFGLTIGYIEFEEIYHGYFMFENDFDENDFDRIINSDNFIYIVQLYIDKSYRNKGIANELMDKFGNFCKKKLTKFNTIILNACPLELSIPLDLLIEFYKKFEFYPIEELSYTNSQMMIKQIIK